MSLEAVLRLQTVASVEGQGRERSTKKKCVPARYGEEIATSVTVEAGGNIGAERGARVA